MQNTVIKPKHRKNEDNDDSSLQTSNNSSSPTTSSSSSNSNSSSDHVTNQKSEEIEDYDRGDVAKPYKNPVSKNLYIGQYRILSEIGRGNYGNVVAAKDKQNQKFYAIKIITKKTSRATSLAREMEVIEMIRDDPHPYIINTFLTFHTNGHLCHVMEYMKFGSLMHHISCFKCRFSENRCKFYTASMVLAIDHLHGMGIVHKDVKPDNMLIDKKGFIKLTDFSLSEQGVFNKMPIKRKLGTKNYKAPEMFNETRATRCVDYWALGISLHVMLTGTFPDSSRPLKIKRKLASKPAENILNKMLDPIPSKRLGFNSSREIMNHTFFDEVDWDDLENRKIIPPVPKAEAPHHKSPVKIFKAVSSINYFVDLGSGI